MYKNILIPTDGSVLANKSIRAGVKLAFLCGARVTGLFVAPAATPLVYSGIIPVAYRSPDENAELIRRAATRHLGVIRKAAEVAGVTYECLSLTGDYPAESILEVAKKKKCDLIVMASHGRKGMTALMLGSETQKVLAQTRIPVLVHR